MPAVPAVPAVPAPPASPPWPPVPAVPPVPDDPPGSSTSSPEQASSPAANSHTPCMRLIVTPPMRRIMNPPGARTVPSIPFRDQRLQLTLPRQRGDEGVCREVRGCARCVPASTQARFSPVARRAQRTYRGSVAAAGSYVDWPGLRQAESRARRGCPFRAASGQRSPGESLAQRPGC